jgi:osmotically-inducible protein OsmY
MSGGEYEGGRSGYQHDEINRQYGPANRGWQGGQQEFGIRQGGQQGGGYGEGHEWQSRAQGRSGWGQGQGREHAGGYGGGSGFTDWQSGGDEGYGRQASGQQGYSQQNYQTGYGQRYGQSGWGRGQHEGRGPKGYRRSDERIREDVSEELTRHPEVDASEIEVSVQDGEVTLSGTVEDRRAKRLAEDVVERVSGVNEVHNQLRARRGLGQKIADMLTGSGDDDRNRETSQGGSSTGGQSGSRSNSGTSSGSIQAGTTGQSASGQSSGSQAGQSAATGTSGSRGRSSGT